MDRPSDFEYKPQIRGHILHTDPDEKRAFLSSFDAVVTSFNGVLWLLNESIPDALKGLQLLQKAGKTLKFTTNISIWNDDEIITRLRNADITNIVDKDIFQPVKLIADHINHCHTMPTKTVFSLCGPEMNMELEKYGITVKTTRPMRQLDYVNIGASIVPNDRVEAVVMDVNFNLSYNQLAKARKYLELYSDCELLIGNGTAHLPVTKKFQTMGFGGFVSVLSHNLTREPLHFAKPSNLMVDHVLEHLSEWTPNRVLYVGSNTSVDLLFANKCGFQTLFLFSAPYTVDEGIDDQHRPDYIADSFADFIPFFEDLGGLRK